MELIINMTGMIRPRLKVKRKEKTKLVLMFDNGIYVLYPIQTNF
jgi:hypothetical protein